MRLRSKPGAESVSMQFASLIDVVFLLLIFFMLTLRITAQEGDLAIEMPAASGPPWDTVQPPLDVRLVSDSDGNLARLRLNGQSLGGGDAAVGELRREMTALFARLGTKGEPLEVEIDADHQLHYRHVVGAVSAVSGRTEKRGDGERVVRYPVKIRFAPPRR